MKTNINYIYKFLLLFPLIFLTGQISISQTFSGNIQVPNLGEEGIFIGDIYKTPSYFFVYSINKLVVYNNNGDYISEIPFNNAVTYGKFNPLYFWDSHYTSSTSLMTLNDSDPDNPILYFITPNLDIGVLDLNSLSTTLHAPQALGGPGLTEFKPLHGNCILKYDKSHERLYWVIDGQNNLSNTTGSFHVRQRYLFIFNIDNTEPWSSQNHILTYFSEHIYSNPNNYEDAGILDIEINENNIANQEDYFYLSKINSIEIWRIDTSLTPEVDKIYTLKTYDLPGNQSNYGCDFYKMGLEYIKDVDNSIHKIIAFPYRFPSCTGLTNPEILMLDANHDSDVYDEDWVRIASPAEKITDVEYLSYYQHLVMTHADYYNVPGLGTGEDVSIYKLFSEPESSISLVTREVSDGSLSLTVHKDFNTPIKIIPVSSSEALICKEDEICYLENQGEEDYDIQSKLVAENNFFLNGVSFGGKKFIINAVNNGIEVLDAFSNPELRKNLGFQANHICMDDDGDKFYIFNKLSAYDAGCFIYDLSQGEESLDNINSFGEVGNEITAPIGDCIYNPFQDHFLISENGYFDNRAAGVLVYRNKEYNNLPNTVYTSLNLSYDNESSYFAKDMFISPAGLLYVFADMNYNQAGHPKVFVFSAIDPAYTFLGCHILESLPLTWPGSDVNFDFYRAHFCYNDHNSKVYATIDPQLYSMCPYNTVTNGTFEPYVDYEFNTGLLIEFDQEQISNLRPLSFPGEIICPDNNNPNEPSRYGENMYVIGPRMLELLPPYYSIIEDNTLNIIEKAFNDITYCPKNDKMYALSDTAFIYDPVPDPAPPPTHRVIKVYPIEIVDGQATPSEEPVIEEDGQASCIFHNPYDGKIYIQQKTDEFKFGETAVRLIGFEPESDPFIVTNTDLGVHSLYPELDHNDNGIFAFFFYNLTTPCINPYNNTIYVPNGGHSCVSKVSFDANEALRLQDGAWSWVSFPRMNRTDNTPVDIPIVLDGNISPDEGNHVVQTGNLQYHVPLLGTQTSYYVEGNGWNDAGPPPSTLFEVQSALGYKLYLNYGESGQVQPDEKWLFMQGSLYSLSTHLDPNCSSCPLPMNTPNVSEYWAGYYLPVSQNIPDALPDELESKIHIVKGQYFTCYSDENQTDGIIWRCICNKGSAMLNYGDMAIITLKPNETIDNFYWAYYNNVPVTDDKSETEFYSFTETADYIPIFIELDSNSNPLEIGAFVNDSCIGGTCVLPDDSVVLIAAYPDSLAGEIYFEEYYGTNKNLRPPVFDYYVQDPQSKQRKKGVIHTREKQDYYVVSFNNNNVNTWDKQENDSWISCMPNPVNANSMVKCYVPVDAYVNIILFDMMGSKQMEIYSGMLAAGTHSLNFGNQNSKFNRLHNGTYILHLQSAMFTANSKIILIK